MAEVDAELSRLLRLDDAADRALLENVRPSAWSNPDPPARYNLVVIGGGTAGLVSAIGAGVLGAKVALVEGRLLGGDCLNFGCVPSKALLRAGHTLTGARRATCFGAASAPRMDADFASVMGRVREVRAAVSVHDAAQRVRSFGVDVYLGHARFVANDALDVDGQRLRFAKAIIATGSRPQIPEIPGLKQAGYLSNETLFSLERIPARLLVLGAGPVGTELAQAMSRLGAEVSLITRAARILPREDADVSELLRQRFESDGIRVYTDARVERVERQGEITGLWLTRNGEPLELRGEALLVAAGRTPNIHELGLEDANVRWDEHGVSVDDRLRTSNRRIYAAGDICSRYRFTHAAEALARVALQNALFFGRKRASRLLIPWCTYTEPQVAHVGVGQREADELGLKTHTVQLDQVDRSIIDGLPGGFARVHVSSRGRIHGATVVASNAGDLISELVLAMNARQSLGKVGESIRPYPTQGEVWKQLADDWNRGRLTPALRRILELFLRFSR